MKKSVVDVERNKECRKKERKRKNPIQFEIRRVEIINNNNRHHQ